MSILKNYNKNNSFLNLSWQKILDEKISARIPKFYIQDDKVLRINNNEDIEKLIINNNDKNFIANIEIVLILYPINKIENLIYFLNILDQKFDSDVKIIINYFSISWKYIFNIFNYLKIINKSKKDIFFSKKKFSVFLNSTSYEISKELNPPPIPLKIPIIFNLLSYIINLFPFLSFFSFAKIFYLRKKTSTKDLNGKLSIIVPCKNEENNISNIVKEAKKNLIMNYELNFINDKSDDATNNKIIIEKKDNPDVNINLIQGDGKGKSFAVEKGIESSDGIYCIILDADLTVKMKDINLFYLSITKGNGDLINGSRLIYNLEKNSMRYLNILGNIFFAKLVSYIISEKITDTLCGTKCFKKSKWKLIKEYRDINNLNDRWGDFITIFGISYYGNKIIDLPVRYYERVEGTTKMNNRFNQFVNMLLVCLKSFKIFKL